MARIPRALCCLLPCLLTPACLGPVNDLEPIADARAADAGSLDATGVDATPANAPPLPTGTATVILSAQHGLESPAGQPVVFHGRDGRVLAVIVVGDDGVAVGPMEPDGMVSFPAAVGRGSVRTTAGVQVDDTIRYDDSGRSRTPPRPRGPVVGTVAVAVPPGLARSTVVAAGRCSMPADPGGGTTVIELRTDCINADGSLDVFAVSRDEALDDVRGFASRVVTPDADGTTEVAFTAWRTDFGQLPITVSGSGLGPKWWQIGSVVGRGGDDYMFASSQGQITEDPLRLTASQLVGVGDTLRLSIMLSTPSSEDDGGCMLDLTRAFPIGPVVLDAADFLPCFRSLEVIEDPARPTLRWQLAAAMPVTTDAIEVVVGTRGDSGNDAWFITLPPDATEVRVPAVPVELASWQRLAGGAIGVGVTLLDRDGVDWDEIRTHPGVLVDDIGIRAAFTGR